MGMDWINLLIIVIKVDLVNMIMNLRVPGF